MTNLGTRIRNALIALGAIAISMTLFLSLQADTSSLSLESQAEQAVPLEVAMRNEKPTVIEFYANWCTSCQTMSQDVAELKNKYNDQINFVMLNVDNDKWLPEMLKYQVDSIPNFTFLAADGTDMGSVIGEQPKAVLDQNLKALQAQEALPYQSGNQGQSSPLGNTNPSAMDETEVTPRSHGN